MTTSFDRNGRRLAVAAVLWLGLAGATAAQVLSPIPGSPFQLGPGVGSSVVRLSPDGGTLWVTNPGSQQLTALAVAPDGSLSTRGTWATAGATPVGIATSPEGRFVYVGSDWTVEVFAVAVDGTATAVQALAVPGIPRNGLVYVRAAGGDFVYAVTNDTVNQVLVLKVDAAGLLTRVASVPTWAYGNPYGSIGAPRIAFAGGRLFVLNDLAVAVFAVGADGALAEVPGSPFLTRAAYGYSDWNASIAVTADGAFVVAGAVDSLEAYAVGADGALTFVGSAGLGFGSTWPPSGLAFHPGGGWLVATEAEMGLYAVLEVPGLQPAPSSPFGANGSDAIQFDAAGALLFGGDPNTAGTFVNVLAFGPGAVPPTHGLSVSPGGNGTGVVASDVGGISCPPDCSATYAAGTVVTLTATPAANSVFVGWTGACTGSGPCVVTIDGAVSVAADFGLRPRWDLVVSKAGSGKGTVTSAPEGISCGLDCAEAFEEGTSVTLTAVADVGSRFGGWAGACTGTGACVVPMDQARQVTATFEKIVRLTVVAGGTGTGTVEGGGISCTTGSTSGCTADVPVTSPPAVVTLTATPGPSSILSRWSGCTSYSGNVCTVSVTAARTVSATFAPSTWALTVRTSGLGKGTVTGEDISCTSGSTAGCTTAVPNTSPATAVTLTAAPLDAASIFTGWSGCTSVSGALCTVSMTGARTVTATFAPSAWTLTVRTAGTGKGTVTAEGISCTSGSAAGCTTAVPNTSPATVVTLTAAPLDASYILTGWSGCATVSGATCTVSMTGAKTVTATFQPAAWTLTARTAGTGRGTITGDGISCTTGSTDGCSTQVPNTSPATAVTLTAAPDGVSKLASWSGCTTVSGDTCTVAMSSARTVTATFQPLSYTVTVRVLGTGTGTVTGPGLSCTTADGTCTASIANTSPATIVALTAAPEGGSTFLSWSGCSATSGTECSVTMTSPRIVSASFGVAAP
jgi:6-phosphogluconolactonase (cycloisomerase 2 family)